MAPSRQPLADINPNRASGTKLSNETKIKLVARVEAGQLMREAGREECVSASGVSKIIRRHRTQHTLDTPPPKGRKKFRLK